jgi:hypothetical protein
VSNSEPARQATDFELWVADEFGRTGGFTALVVLVTISADKVLPLCSTYLHVVDLEIDWKISSPNARACSAPLL